MQHSANLHSLYYTIRAAREQTKAGKDRHRFANEQRNECKRLVHGSGGVNLAFDPRQDATDWIALSRIRWYNEQLSARLSSILLDRT